MTFGRLIKVGYILPELKTLETTSVIAVVTESFQKRFET